MTLAVLVRSADAQEGAGTRLLRQPDVSRTSIVVVYGGDLWLVPRNGGTARRLTANPSIKRFPKFSPDGKWIAFSGNYDGNNDVYVIPAEGGEPKRLTYHPTASLVLGWTPDSKAVLFRSTRASFSPRIAKLFTVPITGGLEKELPLPEANLASFSPDGAQIAYNRIAREFSTWKRYRGGMQSYVSVYNLANNTYWELPHTDTTDFYPMWHGDRIYFASDRTNTVNLFVYDLKSKTTRPLTRFTDYDVKWPSLGPDAIVFEQGGVLHTLDLATEKETSLVIEARSDLAATRPELRHVENEIESFAISPSGARVVFEAHGDLFTVPAKKGDSRDITNTPGVREVGPAWSPDGKWIAYFSDKTGEYELNIRSQDGSGEEVALTHGGTGTEARLTVFGGGYGNPLNWSPDSKALVFTDFAMRLWMVTVSDKNLTLVDDNRVVSNIASRWSPDGKWIAYDRVGANYQSVLTLYSVEQKKAFPVNDGRFNDGQPAFDPSGKYLYLFSDRTFNPAQVAPEINVLFQNQTGIYALVLQAGASSPLGPESDEEKPKDETAKPATPTTSASSSPSPVKIDLDGLARRIVPLPIPPGNYTGLTVGKDKIFYMADGGLHQFSLADREDKVILSGIQTYDINPEGTKVCYQAAGNVFGIVDAAPGQSVGTGKLTLDLPMRENPRAEWTEIFWDAWRMEREFYYDPNLKGLDWKALGNRYAKLLPYVAHRDDLSYLLSELIGELNTSHAYVLEDAGLPTPSSSPSRPSRVGLLGADFEATEGGFYRFKKIYAGENWDPARRAPLTEPGVKVKEGDYLIAVNGAPLKADTNPYAPFQGLAGKTVTLKVNDRPSEAGAWEVQVRPIGDETSLRFVDWVEGNRRRVSEATGGRVGYIYLPDTAEEGITEFGKEFYAQTDKGGVIVDERFNSGGNVPTFFVEKLARKVQFFYTPRYGWDLSVPSEVISGPKAMLINEWSGSGGDLLPYLFRHEGVGPLIGKRTWGGLTGIAYTIPLLGGGTVSAPYVRGWSPQEGGWFSENRGIEPDMEVNNTPDLMRLGHDPQLERAIAYVLEQLKKNPPTKIRHPAFPVERYPVVRSPLD